MIETKEDLVYYLHEDKLALGKKRKPKLIGDYIYKFQIELRYCEFYKKKSKLNPFKIYHYIKYKTLSVRLGFSIPLCVFGPGLSIAHYGTIVVNPSAKIGKNCRLHECVTIGATNGDSRSAKIGDNVFIGSGARIIGNVSIASDVAIAANAVVVKNIDEPGTTWGGIPAKKISNNNSHDNINPQLFEH